MFSNVNEVVQMLYLAEKDAFSFSINWSNSLYRTEKRGGGGGVNPWSYYFKDRLYGIDTKKVVFFPHFSKVVYDKDNIITPRISNFNKDLLLPTKRSRSLANEIIHKYIQPNDFILEIVDDFKSRNFHTFMIGLHIRGYEKEDRLTLSRRMKNSRYVINLKCYYREIDKIIEKRKNSKIFCCSDSSIIVENIIKEYGDRVVIYPATRTKLGGMHKDKSNICKCKLGLDIIVEAYLLSMTDFFVHGLSNVANFVLCKNKLLPSSYVKA